jgi:hypothetical protein
MSLFLENNAHKLTFQPWPSQHNKPEVKFWISYGADAIFLKFSVKEKHFKAVYRQTNDPVYKDSCVEFFIAFDEDKTYYNFEFNAIGTTLVGYGSPGNREYLPVTLINNIKSFASKKTISNSSLPFEWELSLVVPFSLFYKHSISTLKGATCKANFYKCGDDLPEPHFLCWNNIVADTPNFHLPQFFGSLIFD